MYNLLNRIFKLEEKNTTPGTEFIAGTTTFLTMVYIVPLNGMIISAAGMTYVFIRLITLKFKELNPVMLILAAISLPAFVLE